MKRWTVILSVLTLSVLVGWCWLYRAYDATVQAASRDLDRGAAKEASTVLADYRATAAARILIRLRTFSERVAYLNAVALSTTGAEQKADAAFTQLAAASQAVIAASARYNKAVYAVRLGAFEEARDQYRKAVSLDPGDLQAKINLELLLIRIQEESDAAKKTGNQGPSQSAVSDYWNREDNPNDGPTSGAKRIWK